MADKHEEAARKEALAAKYADIVRKREETLKERMRNMIFSKIKRNPVIRQYIHVLKRL